MEELLKPNFTNALTHQEGNQWCRRDRLGIYGLVFTQVINRDILLAHNLLLLIMFLTLPNIYPISVGLSQESG